MGYQTPNIDRIANEGMRFTDYLRRAELHGRTSVVHHRSARIAHRIDQGGPAGRRCWSAQGRPDHRRAAQAVGLCDRAVRQEPPRRPQRISADRARLRRVLRQSVPPERGGRAGAGGLPEGIGFSALSREVRSARRVGLQGHRHRRRDGRPAVRQAGEADRARHRPADKEADGNDRRRHCRPRPSTTSSGRLRPANPSFSG